MGKNLKIIFYSLGICLLTGCMINRFNSSSSSYVSVIGKEEKKTFLPEVAGSSAGSLIKSVEITVFAPENNKKTNWYKRNNNIVILSGTQFKAEATVTLKDGTKSTNVVWSSGDNTIAAVNEGKISAIKQGKTTIAATANLDSSQKDLITLEVLNEENFKASLIDIFYKVDSIKAYVKIDKKAFISVQIGINQKLKAQALVILPDQSKNGYVNWEVSDENIASIDPDGEIIGKKQGITTIIARYKFNPEEKALIDLEVKEKKVEIENIGRFSVNLLTENISEPIINLQPTENPILTPVESPLTPLPTVTPFITTLPTILPTPLPTPITIITPTPTPLPTPIPTPTPVPKPIPTMIFLPSGSFTMGDTYGDGDPNETPLHKVNLSSFYLGKYEVTQKEYKELMGKNPAYFSVDEHLPVENLTWWEAISFCNALSKKEGLPVAYQEESGELITASGEITTNLTKVKGYRLPTEAEWEYAAKGGNRESYCDPIKKCKYAGSDNLSLVSWFSANSGGKTNQIGKKEANELGLHDLSGNVSEWVHDFYGDYGQEEETNPLGPASGSKRIYRRGCWGCYARDTRSSSRYGIPANSRDAGLGFRLARSAE